MILPKPALAALGVQEGGAVEFVYEPGKSASSPRGERSAKGGKKTPGQSLRPA
ncbi:MAG: hypothetical protein Q8K49_08840 [Brevundimonas sp.]|nr:hypothetical protein [Brevundimonas sp.]